MTRRLGKILAGGAAALLIAGALAAPSLAASPFKTGKYKGTTSQGEKFAVVLKVISECGRVHGLCLLTTTQAIVKLTCPNGESETVEDPTAYVPASGTIKQSPKSSDGTVEKTTIQVHGNGTITGSFSVSKDPDSIDPEEATGFCSGSATFKLKHV